MARRKRTNVRAQIQRAARDLKDMMQDSLGEIADDLITRIMKKARRATPAQRLGGLKEVSPRWVNDYRTMLRDAFSIIAFDAISAARQEVPGSRKRFAIKSRLDDLPTDLRRKLIARADLVVGKQIADLQKVIEFAYQTNQDTTDSDDQVESDLHDSALNWLEGPAMTSGSELTASTVINSAREAFFFDDEVLAELDGFEFNNGDPVTNICTDLTEEFGPDSDYAIAPDDPNLFRYTPPLHWNCKSWIAPILKGGLDGRKFKPFRPSSADLEDEIQFAELLTAAHSAKIGCPSCQKHAH